MATTIRFQHSSNHRELAIEALKQLWNHIEELERGEYYKQSKHKLQAKNNSNVLCAPHL